MPKQNLDLKKLEGFQMRSVSIKHLLELREDIEKRLDLVDKHLAEFYLKFDYDMSGTLPEARFLLIVSFPQPITRASFTWQGKSYNGDIPPTYIWQADNTRVKDALTRIVESAGYKLAQVRLPMKTLAVRSGLAQYGRNNITYVPGYGSFQRLAVFATDAFFGEDNWGELTSMKACETCIICRDNCPTRCIPADRFLLHAENCLTWYNERADTLADWIKPDWHNALIGCMRCQLVCPVNKKQLNKVVQGPIFSEEETRLVLQKRPLDSLPDETRRKIVEIALDDSPEILGRNLELLINR
jgi:epoxyqueuosine reductase